GHRRRGACGSIFRSFGGVRIELDQIEGTAGARERAQRSRRARGHGGLIVAVTSSRDAVPCVLAGGGCKAHRMLELVMAGQVRHLDAIGVQTLVVDQPLRQPQPLGWADRLHLDLPLQAFEAVAVGIAEVLVEGDAIIVHLALPSFRYSCRLAYSQASMSARRWRLRKTICRAL